MNSETFLMEVRLKELALSKLMIELWNRNDVRRMIETFPFPTNVSEHFRRWRIIEETVAGLVTALPLPQSLRGDLLKYVYPIGYEFKFWWKTNHLDYKYVDTLPAQLCWLPMGVIDEQDTARKLYVENQELSVHTRFMRAYWNCLEDQITALWPHLSLQQRRVYLGNVEAIKKFDPQRPEEMHLEVFWIFFIHFRESEPAAAAASFLELTAEQRAYFDVPSLVARVIRLGNLGATRFLFENCLSAAQQNAVLADCWQHWSKKFRSGYLKVVFYLLSRMNAQQQEAGLKKCYYQLLMHAVRWSWHDFFLRLANRVFPFMPLSTYQSLVQYVIKQMAVSYCPDVLRRMFIDFWQQSPPRFRTFVLQQNFPWLCEKLCLTFQGKILQVVFEEASVVQKHSLIFDELGDFVCKHLVWHQKWDLLKFFIGACVPNKEIMVEFKHLGLEMVEAMKVEKKTVGMDDQFKYEMFLQIINDLVKEKNQCQD